MDSQQCCVLRRPRAPLPQPLFDALAALDQLVTPAAPVETHVWMAALAAPLIADRLEAVQAGSEGALTDDSSDLDDSALDDGALDADDSSPELDDESDDGDESEALLAAGDARAGEEGMESVQLNRKQRRAMMLADRKKAKAKGEPTPAAVPTNATIQMPARVLRVGSSMHQLGCALQALLAWSQVCCTTQRSTCSVACS